MDIKSFFRNASNYDDLQNLNKKFNGLISDYTIIATIELSEKDEKFFDDFKNNCTFLKPYIYTAKLDRNVFKCVLIKNPEKSMLVVMNGYQYPRYVAIF